MSGGLRPIAIPGIRYWKTLLVSVVAKSTPICLSTLGCKGYIENGGWELEVGVEAEFLRGKCYRE